MLAVAYAGFGVGLQNKIGHPAHCYRQLMQVPVLSARGLHICAETFVLVFSGFAFRNCGYDLSCGLRKRDLRYNDLRNEELRDKLKVVFSPYIIFCCSLSSRHQLTWIKRMTSVVT